MNKRQSPQMFNASDSSAGERRGGRKQSGVRSHFIVLKNAKPYPVVQCKLCKETLTGRVRSLERHLKRCHRFREQNQHFSPDDEGRSSEEPKNKKHRSSNVAAFFDRKPSEKEVQEIQRALVEYVAWSGTSFNSIDSVPFRRFVEKLRPAAESIVPCRQTLSGSLLESVASLATAEVLPKLRNGCANILQHLH